METQSKYLEIPEYVTDLVYVSEYYPELSPLLLNSILSLNGYFPKDLHEHFTWCDIGCGNGLTAVVNAVCYPHADFYGIDINAEHIKNANNLADRGTLENTHFIADDICKMDLETLPGFDFIVMHGFASWVDRKTLAETLDIVSSKLNPGGVLYISYNCMPGWAPLLPLRHLFMTIAEKHGGSSLEKARKAIETIKHYQKENVKFFRDNLAVQKIFGDFETLNPKYFAHEYMNQNFNVFHFAEIYRDLKIRGMEFVGSSSQYQNMLDLAIPKRLHEEFRAISSRPEFEAKKDFIRNEFFHRDVYVKNGKLVETDDDWKKLHEDLIIGAYEIPTRTDNEVDFGEVQLDYNTSPFVEIINTIRNGATKVSNISKKIEGLNDDIAVDAARLLIAGEQFASFLNETAKPDYDSSKEYENYKINDEFNAVLISTLAFLEPKIPLASTKIGAAIQLTSSEAILLLGLCKSGVEGAIDFAIGAMQLCEQQAIAKGQQLSDEKIREIMEEKLKLLREEILPKLIEAEIVSCY